jgi:hypothetical protein
VEFFDVLYLGIFVILSPAFDRRFYKKPPPTTLVHEAAFAMDHFETILHDFSLRFVILLEGKAVSHFYVFHRMLGEFAAAAVVFAKAIRETQDEDCDDGNGEDGVTYAMFRSSVEKILRLSYLRIFPYYSRCVDRLHKHFVWTGPIVQILPRSEAFNHVVPTGEVLDLPSNEIYLDTTPPNTHDGKRRDREDALDDADEPLKKRRS